MVDCSKTLEFVKELNRLCTLHKNGCCECPLYYNCPDPTTITQEHIDKLQEWSDSHPVKTRQSEFFRLFPDVRKYDGIPGLNPCWISSSLTTGGCNDCVYKDSENCQKEYWLEEI